MDTVRWAVTGVLLALSLFVSIAQLGGMIAASRRHAQGQAGSYSVVPLVGGFLGVAGCLLSPWAPLHRFWWVPVMVDPGCAVLLGTAFARMVQKRKRRP